MPDFTDRNDMTTIDATLTPHQIRRAQARAEESVTDRDELRDIMHMLAGKPRDNIIHTNGNRIVQ